ncbi:hypothetical protein [Salinilacihabitans rarus]|uniref:hypothetical protein n=1 Tax=Salinilacihabitans rarus TaxID=2961596 RepID=UPI0020C87CCC|nr:hypothetical protein [Salinilacihabitans rarus]
MIDPVLGPLVTYESLVGSYLGLDLAERAAVHFGVTVVLGTLALGMLPRYGTETVRRSHRSPIISTCVGIPGVLALGTLLYTGAILGETNVGVVFAIPLVAVGATLLPAWTALGFVSLGGVVASKLGTDRLPVWVLVGGLLSAFVVVGPAGTAVGGLASVLGVGAGARVLFARDGLSRERERVVPPANKI